ncbi:MAG TPA: cytochrome c maturation protein CcmE [Candidatus Angelobacter sp.]|jgi:cytochrome c-type biogenesis protein CcmE|nr:cytochrome c maturation protein CcmE [Candidatus Angelobacter sp.]
MHVAKIARIARSDDLEIQAIGRWNSVLRRFTQPANIGPSGNFASDLPSRPTPLMPPNLLKSSHFRRFPILVTYVTHPVFALEYNPERGYPFHMSQSQSKFFKFGAAIAIIVMSLGYLAWTGVNESKSFYVTIKEMQGMGDSAYTRTLRVEGIVKPGSIQRNGSQADFVIQDGEGGSLLLPVSYKGGTPPPDTFKDHAQALVIGNMGRDGTFHAKEVQAKCASKYENMEKAQAGQNSGATTPQKN